MKLRDLMVKEVVTVSPEETVGAAAGIMRDKRIGCLVVTAGGRIEGILTDRDLLACLASAHDPRRCTAAHHMTTAVAVEHADQELPRAVETMAQKKIKRLPIVENGCLVGLVSFSDIAALVNEQWQEMWWALAPVTRLIRAQSAHRRGREPRSGGSDFSGSA